MSQEKSEAFIKAFQRKQFSYIESMLYEGSDINTLDERGRTVLYYVIDGQHFYNLLRFLKYPINPTICDNEGRNLLHHYIDAGANFNFVRFFNQIAEKKVPIFATDHYQRTLLHYAAKKQLLALIANELFQRGIDGCAIDKEGKTALDYVLEIWINQERKKSGKILHEVIALITHPSRLNTCNKDSLICLFNKVAGSHFAQLIQNRLKQVDTETWSIQVNFNLSELFSAVLVHSLCRREAKFSEVIEELKQYQHYYLEKDHVNVSAFFNQKQTDKLNRKIDPTRPFSIIQCQKGKKFAVYPYKKDGKVTKGFIGEGTSGIVSLAIDLDNGVICVVKKSKYPKQIFREDEATFTKFENSQVFKKLMKMQEILAYLPREYTKKEKELCKKYIFMSYRSGYTGDEFFKKKEKYHNLVDKSFMEKLSDSALSTANNFSLNNLVNIDDFHPGNVIFDPISWNVYMIDLDQHWEHIKINNDKENVHVKFKELACGMFQL